MASITLKDIPDQLHAQLVREAEVNRRSLTGEAVRRLEFSFEIQESRNSERDAHWIQEALDSGPEEPLVADKFNAAVQRGVKAGKQAPPRR
jgi:Arc/MetJ-type ribon-helix-helix transcriptional regulator